MLQEPHPLAEDQANAAGDAAAHRLSIARPSSHAAALGLTISFLMNDPVFARLPFGHWCSVLTGQINRGHYMFVAQGTSIVGFVGWALASEENAENWLSGRRALAYADSLAGEMIVLNVWKALTPEVNQFLLDKLRAVALTKKRIYYKRFYRDGRIRRARLDVNEFVEGHLSRLASDK